jgi:hypothetical protein
MSLALDAAQVDAATNEWRQGDVVLGAVVEFLHMADLCCPLSPAAIAMVEGISTEGEDVPEGPQPLTDAAVEGFVVLTQTCDLVRRCSERPFVEISPASLGLLTFPRLMVRRTRTFFFRLIVLLALGLQSDWRPSQSGSS